MDFETIASQIINRRRSSKLKPWQKLKSKVALIGFGKSMSPYNSVMLGNFSNLPRMNSKSVRIFISSTFSDLNLERNVLMKHIYPKLKVYCREKYGFDFYAIDMRWGVPNVSQLDHLGPKTCYDEVEHCKFLSVGPTFITVLGQRYGEYEIPYAINSDEVELIKEWGRKIPEVSPKFLEAFEEWYLCDRNDINQAYSLKATAETFQLGNNNFVRNSVQHWNESRKHIRIGINKIIPVLTEKGLISKHEARKYALSVTEHEIVLGILNADDSDKRKCAAFTRTIKEIDEVLQSRLSNKFLDINDNGTLDEIRFEQITDLRNITLAAVLKENNIRTYDIPWNAIQNDGIERALYLRKFCMDFESKTISLIDKAVSEMSNFENDALYVEVLQHLSQCNEFIKEFHGRDNILKDVKRYIQGDSTDPFVIYGQSGSGKTSVMAKLAIVSRDWIYEISDSTKHTDSFNQFRIRSKHFKSEKLSTEGNELSTDQPSRNSNSLDSVIVIIRFLGTSPGTSTLRQTLKYICRQLVANINHIGSMSNSESFTFIDAEAIRVQDDFQSILNTFYDLLIQLSNMQRHVLIFLDAIDQLEPSDGAYFLGWIRVPLPRYVKLIISTLPDIGGILDNFRSSFLSPASSSPTHLPIPDSLETKVSDSSIYPNFIEVEVLDDRMCEQLLKTRLASNGRCLQPFQWKLVKRALSHCHLTLFIVLVERVVSQWKSWHQPDFILKNQNSQINTNTPCTEEEVALAIKQWPNLELALTVRGAIVQFFESLEHTHGKLLTSHAISYITASRRGVSETEIVDLLSLDDEVLRDVFEHHLPPQVRAPPFVWTRLRNALGSNLAEREADGIVVLFWYHRQFIEAAQDYYLSDTNHKRKIHSNIADYFLGKWAGVKKPFQYPKYLAVKLKLPPSSNEDRMVPPQPYVFEESQLSGKKNLHLNLRKINELPWHLYHSGRMEEFYSEIMFNYEFLYNKLRGTSRSQLLIDLHLPIEAYRTSQIEQFLRSCTELGRLSTQDIRVKLGGLNSALFINHPPLFSTSDTTNNSSTVSTNAESELQSSTSLKPPPPEVFKVYNCIRIAALSLDYQPSSLPIDILGRLTKIYQPPSHLRHRRKRILTYAPAGSHRSVSMLNLKREYIQKYQMNDIEKPVNIYRDLLDKLLIQSRILGSKQCALLPRTICFDSGSGLLHTTFDIGMGIGRLMSNNLILAIALNGKSVSWYDLDGNLVKTISLPEVNLFSVKLLLTSHTAPDPISICALPVNKSPDINNPNTNLRHSDDIKLKDNRLLSITKIDYFSGRVTTLSTLDEQWSDIFSMSSLILLTSQWIGSLIDTNFYLGYLPNKQLVINGNTIQSHSSYYSNLTNIISFTLTEFGAFLIDIIEHSVVNIPIINNVTIFSTIKLQSNLIICFCFTTNSECELRFYEIMPMNMNEDNNVCLLNGSNMNGINFHGLTLYTGCLKNTVNLSVKQSKRFINCSTHLSYSDNLIAYLFNIRRKTAEDFGVIWDQRYETCVHLQLPFNVEQDNLSNDEVNITKEMFNYTYSFGKGVSAIFSYENDLLFTTGKECFLLVWSTMTGHILKIIAQGCAEGILSGLSVPNLDTDSTITAATSIKGTTNSSMSGSVLVICHFPDTTTPQYSGSPDQAMFIMCKIFNVKSLRRPDKQLAVLGSQLFGTDDNANTNLNPEEIATSGPLVYRSANMSIEYVYEDALSTLVLVTHRKEERDDVDNLILYDLDEDSSNPIYSWSDNEINAKSIDTFLTIQQLADWATEITDIKNMSTSDKSLNHTNGVSVFLHTTATKIKVLTIFNNNQLLDSYTFLDPINIKDYLPNLYLPTSNGYINTFGLIQSKYGMLTLIKPSFDDETTPSLLIKVLISDNIHGFKSLWGEQPREINLSDAYQFTETAGRMLLDKRDLQTISLNLLTYRPNYPNHLIIGLNESHKTLYPVTRCDGRTVVWLGVVLIVDLGYPYENEHMHVSTDNYPQVLHTILLDYGPNLTIFLDGMTVINYRLNMYNIVTGNRKYESENNEVDKFLQKMNSGRFRLSTANSNDNGRLSDSEHVNCKTTTDKQPANFIASKLSNEENNYIQPTVLAADGKLLIGKRHHPEQKIHLDLANESSSESDNSDDSETDYGASPARCLVAYEVSTTRTETLSSSSVGAISDIQLNLVTDYMFENEPYMLWLSKDTKTLITVTPNEYLRGFDLGLLNDGECDTGLMESVDTEDHVSAIISQYQS
ncbi:NACHT domain- and WD repeat-containing protein 1 [Schistosoma japonicum]|nr:NACHT domain- and WD repeat-containing protein 1 [Schistosoma japonicum]